MHGKQQAKDAITTKYIVILLNLISHNKTTTMDRICEPQNISL